MIIAVDVDGVVLDTMSEVLARYNLDCHDSLTLDDIRAYDVGQFVRPECGRKIYEYFETPEVYQAALPIVNADRGLLALEKSGHRLIFVTTAAPGTEGVKRVVLKKYGYLHDDENYVECRDKSLIRADVLIDDNVMNLIYFRGERIIFDQPWNRGESVSEAWRARDWDNVTKIVNVIAGRSVMSIV